MEVRMTVHLPRRLPRPVDVVVRWEGRPRVAALRRALRDGLGEPVDVLVVGGRPVADDAVLGMPPLLDGVSVAVLPAVRAGPPPSEGAGGAAGVLRIAVVGGPDAGRSRPLLPPGLDVGRGPASGLRVEDPSLSRVHARVVVDASGVHVEDVGSTNGVLVDGVRVEGRCGVDTRSAVVVGGSTLRLRRPVGAGLPVVHPGDGTAVVHPVAAASTPGVSRRVRAPDPPSEPHRTRVPWLAALVPVPVALGLAVVLGPHLLAFALLGPVMVLATTLGDRWSGGRTRRRSRADHAAAVLAARADLAAALDTESRRRHAVNPDPHAVLELVEHRLPGLWSAPGPGATVRLGLGDVVAATQWVTATGPEPVTVRDVPVVVDLAAVRVLGVVGSRGEVRRTLDWVLGQLCAALRPGRLRLVLPEDDPGLAGWRLVPAAAADAPAAGAVTVVVASTAHGGGAPSPPEDGVVILATAARDQLPAGCAVLEPGEDGRHRLTTPDGSVTLLRADGVGGWWADRVQRALAPLRLPAHGGPDRLPARLELRDLLGPDRLTVDGVRAHWEQAGGDGPVAVVGRHPGGVLRLDLRRDGPHVLVGGTTGSGKSEFLRTLVVGLALESPPERLTLLLVDFKGGAAFGACATLPHVVGLLTDLDDHLVERALSSLRAELRRREEVLAAAGAADVDDLPPGPVRDSLPRLVLVVDELRALVDALPDLARGLVRLAAQGRSLGIHLVLATQRPGGAVTGEVRANVDLRIAFRVRDRSDSVDVVEDPGAADLDPDLPGRALARGADGAVTAFQAALVTPAPRSGGDAVEVEVLDGVCTAPLADAPPRDRAREVAAVVDVLRAAAAGRAALRPRAPWLPSLLPVVRRGDPDAGPGVLAVVDEPDLQRRRPLGLDDDVAVWRFVGRPRTGRTSALRALVTSAVEQRSAGGLHVHVVESGGALAAALAGVPHLGTACRTGDAEAFAALIAHLTGEVARRREAPDRSAACPRLLLVVDGWEALVEADDPRSAEPGSDLLLRLLRDGAGVGLVAAVAGGRALLQTRWQGLGGRTVLLGPPDPLDAAVAGVRAGDLPHDPPPGRGLLAEDRRELQVVAVSPEDLGRAVAGPQAGRDPVPWRYRPLPVVVRRSEVPGSPPDGLLLGVSGPTASPWTWSPRGTAGRLLVAGPPRSGRTNALRVLAEAASRAGRPVVLVGPDDEPEVLTRLLGRHPDLLVLVDDVDRVVDGPLEPVLSEAARRADRGDGALVVATTASSLGSRFRGLDVDTARRGHALLLSPSSRDGDVVGVRLPRAGTASIVPGRGVVVSDGRVSAVQVLLDG
jgi:S-DNA-T family DNA segregation ATPase FtsK/SpoIIIE